MNSIQRYICLGIVCMAIWHTVVFFASPGGSGRRGMGGYERDFNLDSLGYEDDYLMSRKVHGACCHEPLQALLFLVSAFIQCTCSTSLECLKLLAPFSKGMRK